MSQNESRGWCTLLCHDVNVPKMSELVYQHDEQFASGTMVTLSLSRQLAAQVV